MIYTSIRYFRVGSVIVGSLLLILSVFLPYYSSCEWNSDESGTISTLIFSYEHIPFWMQFSLTIAVFFSGYFYRDIVNKALLYTFSSLLILFLLFSLPFSGNPCVPQLEIGKFLNLIGTFFVVLATFISIYREVD